MSLKIIRMPGKISRVRLKEDFSIPDSEFLEEEVDTDPEETARLEAIRLEEERFENRVKEEVEEKVREELEKQFNVLTEKYEKQREEAYRAGIDEGHQNGTAETEARLEPIKENLIKIADKIQSQHVDIIRDAEQVVVKLAFSMAKKIVGDEIESNSEIITKIVGDALKYIIDETSFTIRINPKDYEVIERHLNELATQSDDVKDIKIISDIKIGRGGCIIESKTGTIDARLEAKLGIMENFTRKTEHGSGGKQSDT